MLIVIASSGISCTRESLQCVLYLLHCRLACNVAKIMQLESIKTYSESLFYKGYSISEESKQCDPFTTDVSEIEIHTEKAKQNCLEIIITDNYESESLRRPN